MNNFFPCLPARWLAVALPLLAAAGPAQAQAPTFAATMVYQAGSGTQGLATADFNGDGRLDLATANSIGNSISVLLQAGAAGTFAAQATYSTGGDFCVRLAVGDLNGDGRPDLVTVNQTSNTLSVLLNSATTPGTFAAAVTYATGGMLPRGVAIADVNADGRPDVVVGSRSGSGIGVLLNSATTPGTLRAAVAYAPNTSVDDVAIGDLNGDGRPDIAAASYGSSTVVVLLNSAATPGTFGAASTYGTGGTAAPDILGDLAIGDLNNDGRLDLAASNGSNATVGVLLNSATAPGTFPTATTYATGSSDKVQGVAIGDLTGDGRADLVVASSGNGTSNNTASILVNSSTVIGTFPAAPTMVSTGGTGPVNVEVRDLNADNVPDIAVTNFYDSNVGILLNTTVPVPVLSSAAGASGSSTSTTPLPFTVTFSRAVTGFSASSISVTNGTVGAVSGSGTTYTFSVTPTTAGTATTVTIAANAAQDAVGRRSAVSNPYSLTYAVPITATTWTGTLSSDWFTAGNWSNSVLPSATISATVPASTPFQPTISGNTATTLGLTLNSGATLNMSGGTLDVRGNLTSNGTFVPTGGTVVLGTTAQSNGPNILGSGRVRFWNLTVSANGALLSTSAGASVRRLLTLNGALATQGNAFVLESDATGTALVVNANSAGFVAGAATVQRYLDPATNAGLGYRHFSAAVSGATVGSLATGSFVPVVNAAYNTSATPGTTRDFPTVFGYDQSRLANTSNNLSTFDKGWYSPGALSDNLAVGQGYTLNLTAGQTLNLTGSLNNDAQTLSLARNAGATAADAGLALVGNPYAAPLDWRLVQDGLDRTGLDGAIYVFASSSQYGGTYSFYNNGMGTLSPVLPQGQGFFVRVTPGNTGGALTFRNSHRLTTYASPTYQRTAAETRPLVHLTLKPTGSLTAADEAFVYFEQGATAGFDAQYDAAKLPNPSGLNLSSGSPGQLLSLDGRAPLGTSQLVVPLAVGVPAPGSYTLAAAELLHLGATPTYLRDLQTGTLVDLAQQPSYQFTASSSAALITGRFELVFSPQQVLATVPAALAQQVGVYPNPATAAATVTIELPAALVRQAVQADLADALGRAVRTQQLPAGLGTHTLPLTGLGSGVYALRLTTTAGVVVRKLVVE